MSNKGVDIFVVTHKPIAKPIKKKGYHYIAVGKNQNNIGCEYTDNCGDNISSKNPSYCELTAQYWIWKNVKSDYVGLVHYRRFFFKAYSSIFKNRILSEKMIKKMLKKYDVIVPKTMNVKNSSHYSTAYEQYCWAHYKKDIDEAGNIIAEKFPEYLEAFNFLKSANEFSLFNMIITSKDIFDDYSKFLFEVFFELEKRRDISSYNDYQKRMFGFLGERMLNVYLWKHTELKIKYQSVVQLNDKNVFATYCNKVFKKIFHIKDKHVFDDTPIK